MLCQWGCHIFKEHGGACDSFENVFAILKNNGLRLKIKKCSFIQPSVELLGHVVDKNGVHFDEQKGVKVRDAILPTTRRELRSFLGLASYYRRIIPGFPRIARPLNEKTSDNIKFVWSEDMQTAFEELKVKLISAPFLAYPDYEEHRCLNQSNWCCPIPSWRELSRSSYKLRETGSIFCSNELFCIWMRSTGRRFCIENVPPLLNIEQVQTVHRSLGPEICLQYEKSSLKDRVLVHLTRRMWIWNLLSGETR